MRQKDAYDDLPLRVDLRSGQKREPALSLRSGKHSARSRAAGKPRRLMQGVSAPATRLSERLSSRRVVVKARVIKMTAYGVGAAKLHLRYLDREGTEKGGEREGFFDKDNNAIQRENVGAVLEGEPHQFRLIVSPEDAERLDLTDYTRKLMAQVESDLGRKLNWKAINHYNTDNPHTHIVIHGLDRNGGTVFIDREYISNGIRHRAAELATRELGQRLEHEIHDAIQRDSKARSFTRIDRELLQQVDDHVLVVPDAANTPAARLHRSRLLGRLQELERFGYAEKLPGQQWRLASGLADKLRQLEQHEAAMGRLGKVSESLGQTARHYRLHEATVGSPLEGVVLERGLLDEMSEKGYLILGDREGGLHHVPLGNLVEEEVRVGQVILVQPKEVQPVKPADRNIVEYAALQGGLYQAESHASWAVGQGRINAGQEDSYIQAHRLRLQTLSRLGLVKSAGTDTWQVPADLPEQLQAMSPQKGQVQPSIFRPLHQLPIDSQVTYRGRTWLDEHFHELRDDGQPFGVMGKLRSAALLRAQWLQEQGLEAGTQASRSALDEMERQTVAAQVQQKTGLAFRPLAQGESMQGKVLGMVDAPSTRRYALVANSKEFSMVPWKKDAPPQKGMNLAIGVNQQGRAWSKHIQRGISR